MTWEVGAAVAALIVFFGLTFTARGWIVDRWIDGRLTSVQTGGLLALIQLASMPLQLERKREADRPS